MKDIDMLYREISAQIEEKPSLEDAQLSRKTRYFQRSNRPDSGSNSKKKPRYRSSTVSESSDDEMPTPKPKIRRETKEPDRKIVRIVLSDDDDEKPCSSQSDSDDDIEFLEEVRPVEKYTIKFRADPLAGRLPKWYHKRKAQRAAEDLILAEKRAVRRKLEAEEAEKEAELERKAEEEERIERRRLRDRLRHQKKREEAKREREASEGVTTSSEKKRIVKKTSEESEEPTRNLRKRAPKYQITDPSLDPSKISLDAPDKIPWAKPVKRCEGNDSPPPLPSTTVTTPCPSLPTSPNSEENAQNLLNDLDEMENVGVNTELILVDQTPPPNNPFDDINEPLFFEEDGDLIHIPDEEITDTFLSFMNDDQVAVEELDKYILPNVEND
ncbi:hypothetical protein CRE_24386 [Caenorhabditis remanei]|uniref:Uncharacterized protein n=1 Tax=Caenorhabditis remanei TaxID=31234 RepID=E3MFQ0_CAERE|nr:hypothetical protein CRE_24386 [Caenorhabditis remanei]